MAQGQAVEQPSVEEMADRFATAALREEEGLPPEEEKKPEVEAETEAEPETEAEEETETEAVEAEAEEESQPDRWKFTVKGEDGSDVEVEADVEELKKGYMLEKSYRQKTAQLAREREAAQAKVQEQIAPKMRELEEQLGMAEAVLHNVLAPEMNNTDWAKLADEDPAEWARRKQKVDGVRDELNKVQAARQKLAQESQQQHQAAIQKQVAEARDILQTEIPGWSDEVYGRILRAGVEQFGFRPDEVNAMTDARAIKVLHDAMQYRALKAKPIGDKKVFAKPKVVRPGAGEKADPKATKRQSDMARLKKSGNPNHALPLLEAMLEAEGVE